MWGLWRYVWGVLGTLDSVSLSNVLHGVFGCGVLHCLHFQAVLTGGVGRVEGGSIEVR